MKISEKISEEQRQKLNDLQTHLDYHRRALKSVDYINDNEEFFRCMNRFWRFLSSYDDKETFEYFEHSEYYQNNKRFFSSVENYYVRTIETVEAFNIMVKSTKESQSFLELFDRQLAKENYLQITDELAMVDWQDAKNIVMVGCGPLPETILYLYDNTDIEQIIGLDNNQEAIYIAGEMIKSVHNNSRIRLLHYNGVDYNYKDADLIYVANFITPKIEVLDRIAETAKNGVQILSRTPVSFGSMLYESALDGLNPRLAVIREGKINKYFLEKTLVMQKLDI